jgi:hypothetical protein
MANSGNSNTQSYVFTGRKLNAMTATSGGRQQQQQVEMVLPDSQSHITSTSQYSNPHSSVTEQVKQEMSALQNSLQISRVPISCPFPGDYGFEIAFEQQNKDTKSITWTYSERLRKLYVRMGSTCPIRFRTSNRHIQPPDGCVIRALAVYVKPEHSAEAVTRCPNHATTRELNENHPAPSHLVRCEHKLARYVDDRLTGRQSVVLPHEQPQAGADWVTNLFQFMCFSSCVGGLNRRPVQVVFTLERDNQVLGRQSVELRICACPGRDRRTDEDAAANISNSRNDRVNGRPAAAGKGSGTGRNNDVSVAAVKRHIPGPITDTVDDNDTEADDNDNTMYSLTVHGRANYDLLYHVNEALELASFIPRQDRIHFLHRLYNDPSFDQVDPTSSDLDESGRHHSVGPTPSKLPRQQLQQQTSHPLLPSCPTTIDSHDFLPPSLVAMTTSYSKPLTKPPYKPPTNFYN